MHRIPRIMILLLSLTASACSSGEKSAERLLETARFEERQFNRDHALKLYEEIIRDYPASRAAKDAEARLNELKAR